MFLKYLCYMFKRWDCLKKNYNSFTEWLNIIIIAVKMVINVGKILERGIMSYKKQNDYFSGNKD